MSVTNEELDKKLQDFIEEMRTAQGAIASNQLTLSQRLDTLDLNGTAAHLRSFGNFLKEHPDFMKREADSESKRAREEIARAWLAETFHLQNLGSKMKWVVTAILTGILLAFGTTLVGMAGEGFSFLHSAGHTLFK